MIALCDGLCCWHSTGDRIQARQPFILGLVFHVICLFCLHHALDKLHTWRLFVYGKIFARGKITSGRKSLVKKEKKDAQSRQNENHSVKKRKKNFVKVYELIKPTLDCGRNFRALMEKTYCSYLFKVVVSDLKLHHQQFCRSGLNLQTHMQRKTKSRERCRWTSPEKSKVPVRRLHRVSAQFWHAHRRNVLLEYFFDCR